ncbi:P-loop containing nucleoside triphosphate hydrolase protein [Suillus paluster]|uniref:P-loop containing nucleoside triphosphate hydrolase protein n=1 Tax=Suillus paluster TaxID=48578 RepID=UPI001B87E1B0|nr:P-loop containing nucleoside triphosphate hydrolase protein [Suillus paluster]KAG1725553.1 P-loop containing nucleoside triphosphate hydrolase protein [Suillus paluster]
MQKRRRTTTTRPGKFDPQDARVKHTRIGVWDLYEDRQTDSMPRIPGSSRLETYAQIVQSFPHVVRMLKDILSIKRCWLLLSVFFVVEILASLTPAVSLWYSGQLLRLVETAIETRTVDTTVLIHVAVGRVACTVATRLLQYARSRIVIPLNLSIKQFYAGHIFHSMARLDVPTFENSAVQRQLESTWASPWGSSVAWETIQMSTSIVMTVIRLLSQVSVLFAVLREQQDGPLLAILSLSQSIFHWYSTNKRVFGSLVWAATTTNEDYVRMQGLKHLVDNPSHRKELVAGNLGEYVTAQFRETAQRVGDDAGEFQELRRAHAVKDRLSIASILREPMRELPQIVFTLRAVQKPMTIPLSLASLTLINQTSNSFSSTLFSLFGESFSLAEQFANVRKLYEIDNVKNKVVDGAEPFPENQQSLRTGISVEFRNVSFQYPGAERYALRNVSFKIGAGQLCVIVGVNGSGKSTILKLISRIYDPTEGTILIDNRDIKTLRLADLRAAMSILFQDYTHFPLSINENIALGNPALAHDYDKVREAARLGGAEHFIDELPDGFDTYLDRPVKDYYSGLPEGTTMLFGRPVDYSRVRGAGGLRVSEASSLSGGQMQRLAVSRTFMRSLVSETESLVGMLLFDEPSASLDPTAEHDLFERLRKLRGNKTMIFSSHRFGSLTRHADLILYMDESIVQEEGTHDDLLKRGGEYARIWNLQAEAFI